jgi:hypothetical protein
VASATTTPTGVRWWSLLEGQAPHHNSKATSWIK